MDAEATNAYDDVIFATVPTGHTVRLVSLPGRAKPERTAPQHRRPR